jgi:hypothetical protein
MLYQKFNISKTSITLLAILIIIYFGIYPFFIQKTSQISSFSQNDQEGDVKREKNEKLKNRKQIRRFPRAIIVGSPKCGNFYH